MRQAFLIGMLVIVFQLVAQAQDRHIIHFDFDKYELSASGRVRLDSLTSGYMGDVVKISLSGHCDYVGNHEYNDQLSLNRVNTVKNYLSGKGIGVEKISTEGHGKRLPLNANATETDRLINRRVEINIERRIDEPKQQTPPQEVKEVPETSPAIEEPVKEEPKSLTKQIADTTTKQGTNIVLKNMNFIGGRHVLLPGSVPILEELLQVMKDNPNLEIEIQGHICCTPGSEDGIDIDYGTPNLSVMRAKAVYEYLIGHGIHKKRLAYRGFGHQYPKYYPEDTEAKRTGNRRVEIRIVKK